jgi:hypothetical protein
MTGVKDGSYTQTYVGNGFLGSVEALTSEGVTDTLAAGGHEVTFAGENTRGIALTVGTQAGDSSRMATIDTRSSGGGSDTAAMPGDALVYEHDGAPTTITVTLDSVTQGKGASTLRSGPIAVGRDATVTVKPNSWTSLTKARIVTRAKGKRARWRTVRGRGSLPVKLALSKLGVSGGEAHATVRIRKAPAGAVGGVVLRVLRGRKVVARQGFSVEAVVDGAKTYTFSPPSLAHGRYVLRADAIVSAAGAQTGRKRVSKTRRVKL